MMPALWIFLFFVFFGATLLAVSLGFRVLESQRKRQVTQILKNVAPEKARSESRILIGPDPEEELRRNRLASLGPFRALTARMQTAGLRWSVQGVLLGMLACSIAGALLGARFNLLVYPAWSITALAIVGLFFPLLIIGRKRHKRLAEFEKQFPDALDFISRSVKAGHAFSVSLELLANEANEPLR